MTSHEKWQKGDYFGIYIRLKVWKKLSSSDHQFHFSLFHIEEITSFQIVNSLDRFFVMSQFYTYMQRKTCLFANLIGREITLSNFDP